jgi:hypothetical protein
MGILCCVLSYFNRSRSATLLITLNLSFKKKERKNEER